MWMTSIFSSSDSCLKIIVLIWLINVKINFHFWNLPKIHNWRQGCFWLCIRDHLCKAILWMGTYQNCSAIWITFSVKSDCSSYFSNLWDCTLQISQSGIYGRTCRGSWIPFISLNILFFHFDNLWCPPLPQACICLPVCLKSLGLKCYFHF